MSILRCGVVLRCYSGQAYIICYTKAKKEKGAPVVDALFERVPMAVVLFKVACIYLPDMHYWGGSGTRAFFYFLIGQAQERTSYNTRGNTQRIEGVCIDADAALHGHYCSMPLKIQ